MSLTCLPRRVSQCLRVLGPCFRHRHQLVFSWLLVWPLVYGERANLKAFARHGPQHLAYQQYRRLLCAAYWCTKTLLWWFADQAMQAFPPPEDGILYLVGDSMLTGKRGAKHPVAHKTRVSQYHPSVYGMALPRPWKFAQGKAFKDLVTHVPRGQYTQIRIPTVNPQRRRTFWVYATRIRLRHVGDVTVVLSQCRRNDGPRPTKILVTHLPETVTAREIGGVYLRRWWIELRMKELKGVVGLGPHQVTRQADRVERSVAIAIMAYLLRLRLRAQDIPTDRPWSAFCLQRACAWEVVQAQSERSARQMARKWLQRGKAA
jgi:hypothetical protein